MALLYYHVLAKVDYLYAVQLMAFINLVFTRSVNWQKRSLKMVSLECFVVMSLDFWQPFWLAQRISFIYIFSSDAYYPSFDELFWSNDYTSLHLAHYVHLGVVRSVVNIGATALVTEAATAIFGEAGVSAATGVMTVCSNRVSLTNLLQCLCNLWLFVIGRKVLWCPAFTCSISVFDSWNSILAQKFYFLIFCVFVPCVCLCEHGVRMTKG